MSELISYHVKGDCSEKHRCLFVLEM